MESRERISTCYFPSRHLSDLFQSTGTPGCGGSNRDLSYTARGVNGGHQARHRAQGLGRAVLHSSVLGGELQPPACCLMTPKMVAPALSLSSRDEKGDKAKGQRAKCSLLVKTCLLLQKLSPPHGPSPTCCCLGLNHMASSSCKGAGVAIKGFRLQSVQ